MTDTPSEQALHARTEALERKENILSGARAYLSGPMDFVASRAEEKHTGWRNRVGQFLQQYGTTIYDPWHKPSVMGMPHYGKEDEFSTVARAKWIFEDSARGESLSYWSAGGSLD